MPKIHQPHFMKTMNVELINKEKEYQQIVTTDINVLDHYWMSYMQAIFNFFVCHTIIAITSLLIQGITHIMEVTVM